MLRGTYIRTGEIRNKISKTLKGIPHSEETKRKLSEALKGKTRSEEYRKHISEAKKGKPSPMKGKHFSEESKKKMSKIKKGKHLSEETKKKLSGENNHNWKGGKSFEPYPMDWTNDLREAIRKRDDYVCQMCGIHQDELKGWNKKLDIHHIDYDKDNLDPKNLITLCKSCHMKTNSNREYWINYFREE